MDPPPSLKLYALGQVLKQMKCTQKNCNGEARAFQLLGGVKGMVWCQKHYEDSMFYHDNLKGYYTYGVRKSNPFRVCVGETIIYIYNNQISSRNRITPIISADNAKIFIGSSYDQHQGNTILFTYDIGVYIYVAHHLLRILIAEEIVEYYSFVDEFGSAYPVAVGIKHVYFPNRKWQYISKENIKDDEDIVTLAYRMDETLRCYKLPYPVTKVIQKD